MTSASTEWKKEDPDFRAALNNELNKYYPKNLMAYERKVYYHNRPSHIRAILPRLRELTKSWDSEKKGVLVIIK